ncbi:MAG: hypothetical protein WC284_12740 [Candidimonas sp.]
MTIYNTAHQKRPTMHVGKITNTDRKCAVVLTQNPHNPSMALVVDTDSLPPRLHDAIMDVIESPDAQTNSSLASVLQRRIFTDSGVDILTTLHNQGYLQSQPIDNITLFPYPNNPIPLSMAVNQSLSKTYDDNSTVMESLTPYDTPRNTTQETVTVPDPSLERYNPYTANQAADKTSEMLEMAKGLLIEADMLMMEVQKKRDRAYQLAPSLKPKAPTPVEMKPVTKQETEKPKTTKETAEPKKTSRSSVKK